MTPILITILMTTLVNNASPAISSPTRPLNVCEEIGIELQLAIDASVLTPKEAQGILNRCYELKSLRLNAVVRTTPVERSPTMPITARMMVV